MKKNYEIVQYAPTDVLKNVAENVWLVDGPIIWFGFPWLKMPFPTRMTIIRMGDSDLLVHSPTRLTAALSDSVQALGRVRWLVGPNRLHHAWLSDWKAAFPAAQVYLAPGFPERIRRRMEFPFRMLSDGGAYPWDGEITTCAVGANFFAEVEFFHRRSRTLVLTDLIENFEEHKLASPSMRLLAKVGGVLDPNGSMPKDMRVSFRKRRSELRAAIEMMISWHPERIIIAHGRWYEQEGAKELQRAFRWLLH